MPLKENISFCFHSHNQLLEAVKLVYRKRHLGDDSIGWEELRNVLHDALCNVMGNDGFIYWSSNWNPNERKEDTTCFKN